MACPSHVKRPPPTYKHNLLYPQSKQQGAPPPIRSTPTLKTRRTASTPRDRLRPDRAGRDDGIKLGSPPRLWMLAIIISFDCDARRESPCIFSPNRLLDTALPAGSSADRDQSGPSVLILPGNWGTRRRLPLQQPAETLIRKNNPAGKAEPLLLLDGSEIPIHYIGSPEEPSTRILLLSVVTGHLHASPVHVRPGPKPQFLTPTPNSPNAPAETTESDNEAIEDPPPSRRGSSNGIRSRHPHAAHPQLAPGHGGARRCAEYVAAAPPDRGLDVEGQGAVRGCRRSCHRGVRGCVLL